MTTPAPTLSTAGWIVSPQQKADRLMAWLYESQANQSYVFNGNVTSLQYLIAKNAGNIPATCTALQTALTSFFSRYYDLASVQVASDDVLNGNESSLITLYVYAELTEDGVVYPLNSLIELSSSKLVRVLALNNAGASAAQTVLQGLAS
ncbi:hypothetical protein [Paraburkholderia adhaesiva]|uniref:hypothetical protein n=1 Tax=Paraburkholderia adhaesiva TaxID=2883244 RepID=UPI001F468B26|nr:hypothetical protein [Paraburkholderia adhaesiva]